MAGKQIIDLETADSFNEGDLLLVRKSNMGVDRKITYSNFVESIGNPAINGYRAELDEQDANKIVLRVANNAPAYKYYEGMKISFISPAKTTGLVRIRIEGLEYKNLCKHKTDVTVSLQEGDYVEAVLIDNGFQQVNDLKAIVEKRIIDLETVNSFDQEDTLLIRKSGTDINKKINFSDFLQSIGSSAVNGYVASLDNRQENKFTLKAASNIPVHKYYQGMKISFKAPAKTTGAPQVKIGELAYKSLFKHKSDIPISFEENDYIEALLIGDNFYQVNDLKSVANIYTNDYICVAHEIPKSGISTDLTVVTAYGLHKKEYYNGMSITFMCPIDTKGAVRINIDGLGAKDVIEGDIEEFLHNPLYKGQIVHAIYNGVCFVKNKFEAENPKIRQSLEPCPTSSIEEKIEAVTPLENILEFNIGSGSSLIGSNIIYHFPTLRAALEEILSKYSDTSGKRVTLNILTDLTTSKDSVVIKNRDLSWITIKGNTKNKIYISYDGQNKGNIFFALTSCKNFNFAKNTVITVHFQKLPSGQGSYNFFHLESCDFSMQDITLDFLGINLTGHFVGTVRTFIIYGGVITMRNVIATAATGHLRAYGEKKSIISLTNCKFNNYSSAGSSHNFELQSPNSELNITNCDLSRNGTSEVDNIYVCNHFATITQINSRAKAMSHGTCAPNTSDQYARYIVTGSQDEVGTDK